LRVESGEGGNLQGWENHENKRFKGKRFRRVPSSTGLSDGVKKLKSGDIVFFVKKPEKREVGEIIGHIGIIRVAKGQRTEERAKPISFMPVV